MSRLFADVAKYCKKYELNDEQMSTLLGVYCYTHKYNKSLDILSYEEVYDFFKELIIHHSVLVRQSDIFKRHFYLGPFQFFLLIVQIRYLELMIVMFFKLFFQSPPDHINLYSIEEAKNILKHFLSKYLTCLPLIRHLCVPRIVNPK